MRKGWIVLIVVVLLVAVVTLVSWNRRDDNVPQPAAEDAPERTVLVDGESTSILGLRMIAGALIA